MNPDTVWINITVITVMLISPECCKLRSRHGVRAHAPPDAYRCSRGNHRGGGDHRHRGRVAGMVDRVVRPDLLGRVPASGGRGCCGARVPAVLRLATRSGPDAGRSSGRGGVPLSARPAGRVHRVLRESGGSSVARPRRAGTRAMGEDSHVGRGDAAARRRGARYVGRERIATGDPTGDRIGAADHGGGMVADYRVAGGRGRFRFRARVQRPALVGDHADLLRLLQ